jgi:hydroxymethylpyrimidine pyrophosphatase-like HAD family hydrolase
MTQKFYEEADQFAANVHSLAMIRELRTPVPELKAHLKAKAAGVQKIQIFFRDMGLRAETLQTLPAAFPDLVVTTSIVNNIELNSREATKGVALTKLAAHLGIPVQETMSFGDDRNDISMLLAAGIGVAMGNAEDVVKQAADYVTDDCALSGVARAMRHFLWED